MASGRASQDRTRAAGRKRPGGAGKGAGAAWEGKGFRRGMREGGRIQQRHRAPESRRTGLRPKGHLELRPVLTCTRRCGSRMVRCPGIPRGGVEPAGPRTEADPPEQLTVLRTSAAHLSLPGAGGPCGSVVSLGGPQRLQRDQTYLCSGPLPSPHTAAAAATSQEAPKALPARRRPCGLGRWHWLSDFLRVNVGRE